MRQFNCTTPFSQHKTVICEDPQVAMKALALYKEYQFNYKGNCLKPCNYLQVKLSLEAMINSRYTSPDSYMLRLKFQGDVKKVRAFYIYPFKSLIAEIGGWVGLFLGMSLYQVTSFFKIIYNKLKL